MSESVRGVRGRVLGAAFVVSGAVALLCETVWFRSLSLLFGSTLAATGMLLAIFMSGLAIGGEIGGRIADRLEHPARAYAFAEAFVAMAAFISPHAFRVAQTVALSRSLPTRIVVATVLLGPPTLAMGSTLPFLTAALVSRRDRLREGLGALYAANLFGAAFGAFTGAHVLLPRAGLSASTRVIGVIGLSVAAVAYAASTSRQPSNDTEPAPSKRHPHGNLALVLAALCGLLTFSLQVTWNRVFALLLGSSAYTFGLVAAIVLVGNALGGLWGTRSVDDAWRITARRALLFAISVYLGTLVILVAPFPLAAAASRGASVAPYRLVVVVTVALCPSFLAGALFPLLAAQFPIDAVGRTAGRAQLVVTAGNVAGSVLAAFVGVPLVGAQRLLGVVALTALVVAVLASIPNGRDRVRGTLLAAVLACGFAYFVHPTWDPASLSAGSFRVAAYRSERDRVDAPCGPDRRFARHRVLFAREGTLATVVVLGHPSDDRCSLYSLRINGKAEGSVFVEAPLRDHVPLDANVLPVGDLPTEVMAGWLPGAIARDHANVFLVGWGTGLSARGLLATSPSRVTAVEIEPSVMDAADLFEPATRRDPRVDVVIDDARVVLARTPAHSLDVITSHPSNPWVAGAGALFSAEYFSAARERLRPGGTMLAWIQLYDTDRDVVRGQLATFHRAFPNTFVFRPTRGASDLVLLGIAPPAPTTRDALRAALRDAHVDLAELARAGFADATALVDAVIAEPDEVARITRGARAHTEDDAWVEFAVADHLLRGDGEDVESIVRTLFSAR